MNYKTVQEASKAFKNFMGEHLPPNAKTGVRKVHIMGDTVFFTRLVVTDPVHFTQPADVVSANVFSSTFYEAYRPMMQRLNEWRDKIKTERSTVCGYFRIL
jgi:hypothetical protein